MNRLSLIRRLSYDWKRPHWRVIYYHDIPAAQADRFREQLQWLGQFFRWVSVDEGVTQLREGAPAEPIATVTFDDADRTVYESALPILSELKIPACVYVVPSYIHQGLTYRSPRPSPTMTWPELEDWRDAGHEIGSHTFTHALMTHCTPERFRQEALWSKEELQQRLGQGIRHFAYPWGQYNESSQTQLRELAAYDSIATTRRGPMRQGHDPTYLFRDRVSLEQSPQALEESLRLVDRFYRFRKLRRWRQPKNTQAANPEWSEILSASKRP